VKRPFESCVSSETLHALGLAPAGIFGTSSGGIFALTMLIRHQQAVRAARLHERALFTPFEAPEAAEAP
jgi:pimeloyl-ACP methyl ester carboxylesterase